MADLKAMRVVYKQVDGQEIDADVYIPDAEYTNFKPIPTRECNSLNQ